MNNLLKILNLILLLSGIIQIFTGLSLALRMFSSNINMLRAVAELHEYNGFVFTGLVLVHILLNWAWIKRQYFTKS